MKFTTKPLAQLALAAVAICGLTSFYEEPKTAVLRIRVGHVDCVGKGKCGGQSSLQVSAHDTNVWGWEDSVSLKPVDVAEGPSGWYSFSAPVGSRVAISAYFPKHALVEKWVEMDSADQKEVTILLEAPEPDLKGKVEVALPVGTKPWADSYIVLIRGRSTGHLLKRTDIRNARNGVWMPRGEYRVEVHGEMRRSCGTGRPRPEDYVRDYGELEFGPDAVTKLQLEKGGLLGLWVDHPDSGLEAMDSPNDKRPLVIGQRWAGYSRSLLRARLVSKDTQQVYKLTWGWKGLYFVIPRSEFPPNTEVSQIVPVPFGQYELIIRGQNIQEYRQDVTLAPGKPIKLKVSPKLRDTKIKAD